MTTRLLLQETKHPNAGQRRDQGSHRILIIVIIGVAGVLLLGLLRHAGPDRHQHVLRGERGTGRAVGYGRAASRRRAGQSIPANYLYWYRQFGQQYGVPWTILAGIGTVESDNGQTTLPGVHSGSNAFGAAGPMQIGIGGAGAATSGADCGPPGQPGGQRRGHR